MRARCPSAASCLPSDGEITACVILVAPKMTVTLLDQHARIHTKKKINGAVSFVGSVINARLWLDKPHKHSVRSARCN